MFKKSYLFLFVLIILFLSFGTAFAIDLTLETGKSESINFENYFIYNSDKSITVNIAEGDNVISVTKSSYTIKIEAKRSGTAKLTVGVHSSKYDGLDRDGNPVWIYQNTIYTYNITVKDNTPKTTNFEIRYNNQTVTGQKIKVDLTEKMLLL